MKNDLTGFERKLARMRTRFPAMLKDMAQRTQALFQLYIEEQLDDVGPAPGTWSASSRLGAQSGALSRSFVRGQPGNIFEVDIRGGRMRVRVGTAVQYGSESPGAVAALHNSGGFIKSKGMMERWFLAQAIAAMPAVTPRAPALGRDGMAMPERGAGGRFLSPAQVRRRALKEARERAARLANPRDSRGRFRRARPLRASAIGALKRAEQLNNAKARFYAVMALSVLKKGGVDVKKRPFFDNAVREFKSDGIPTLLDGLQRAILDLWYDTI
jgi:hypothetical protein